MSEQSHTYTQHFDVPEIDPPQRVVSLVPSITESLFDLNLGDRLVGITDYCVHPAAKVVGLARVGGTKNPNVAQIIDLRPDLVIANREENRREDVEALDAAGVPVWVTFPRTVPDVFNLLWNLMYLFEETSMVPRVRLIEQTYDWVQNASETRTGPPCRVFVPIWWEPLMTFNADTYAHDLLRVCGGTNVFADRVRQFPLAADQGEAEALPADDPRVAERDTRYPRVTLEEVVQAQPDIILLPNEPFAFDETHRAIFAGLDVPAAHSGRIHLVDGSLLTWHGTRIAYALDRIPPLLCEDSVDDPTE
jgi:ABC-type Fe3+-hydroxamate transport system substrate-binding protein